MKKKMLIQRKEKKHCFTVHIAVDVLIHTYMLKATHF